MQYALPAGLPASAQAAFAALGDQPGSFWLDSGDSPGEQARYHFLGCRPSRTLRIEGEDPLPRLRALIASHSAQTAGDRPAARIVGYLAYDVARFIERVPSAPLEPSGHDPDADFRVYDASVTYDLATDSAWITASDRAEGQRLERALEAPPRPAPPALERVEPPTSRLGEPEYGAEVQRVLELIAAGDTYQVNLSHRFDTELPAGTTAPGLYRRLRARHPAPYGAFLDLGCHQVLSNSPEGFLSVDLRSGFARVRTWPLKGTRPASVDPAALRSDPKDRAEHVMIVDLERNDLGRIAEIGTVTVPNLLDVVSHSTVHHLESRIEAVPRPGVDLIDVLRATFPGGSITGAPKVRAMEIIHELERRRRGVYCGALGYIDWDGRRSRWSIPIRTATMRGQTLSFSVGGGIVADSDPSAEYRETLTKARAFFDVLSCDLP